MTCWRRHGVRFLTVQEAVKLLDKTSKNDSIATIVPTLNICTTVLPADARMEGRREETEEGGRYLQSLLLIHGAAKLVNGNRRISLHQWKTCRLLSALSNNLL